jgi:uncharacterized protein (TIGR02444 family)
MGQLMGEEGFTRFALAVYDTPGIPDACLLLQDRFDVDVNLLLFAAFLGALREQVFTPAGLDMVHGSVGAWQREVVRPLRELRRRLKTGPAPAPNAETAQLRNTIQGIELQAELIELAQLEALGSTLPQIPAAGNGEERATAAMTVVIDAQSHRDMDNAERHALTAIARAAAQDNEAAR